MVQSNTSIARCLSTTKESDRHALYGASLLATASASKLEYLLPQLVLLTPCLKEAAAALGATYRSQVGRQRGDGLKTRAALHYATAIQLIQDALHTSHDEPVALLLACFLLAVTEVIRDQVRNAVAHLRGIASMVRHLQDHSNNDNGELDNQVAHNKALFLQVEDQLSTYFQTFTLHISTHAMSYQPTMFRASKQFAPDTSKHDPASSELRLISALQLSLTWAAKVCQLKYHPDWQSSELLIEQGSHLAGLKLWQDDFNTRVLPGCSPSPLNEEALIHALTLHIICLSAIIHVSNVLSPYEVHYDLHAHEFQQIVADAETVLALSSYRSSQQRRPNTASQSASDDFEADQKSIVTTKPGIIQPLFLTAEKYRHPIWRRRAISCLARAGLELPFNGPREAAIAARIVQHEESWSDSVSGIEHATEMLGCAPRSGTVIDETDVSEAARLNGCVVGRPRDRRIDLGRTIDSPTTVVDVSFHRVADLECMIACENCDHGEDDDGRGPECRHRQTWREEIMY